MHKRHTLRYLVLPALAIMVAALSACRVEDRQPRVPSITAARVKAIQQAERERAEAEAKAQGGPPAAAPGSGQAAGGGGPASEAAPTPTPHYLPPSEQGAYVEITETPVGGERQPPAASAAGGARSGGAPGASAAPGSAAAGAKAGGDAGGNMPVGTAPRAGAAGSATGTQPAARSTPGIAGESPGLPTGGAAAATTRAEKLDALDGELARKLKEFDALMKRAQTAADQERAALAAGGPAAAGGGEGGRLEAPPDGAGAGGTAAVGTGLGATPDLSGERSLNGGRPPRGGPTPVQLPNSSDDDIVARQLREAAERESDPILRDKLWVEYRKYKGGLGGP